MKGYRKIGTAHISVCPDEVSVDRSDVQGLDEQIRRSVHTMVIDHAEKTGVSDYEIIIRARIKQETGYDPNA